MKLFNKHVTCYFNYLKNILNDDWFREYINPMVFINLKKCYNEEISLLSLKYMLQ